METLFFIGFLIAFLILGALIACVFVLMKTNQKLKTIVFHNYHENMKLQNEIQELEIEMNYVIEDVSDIFDDQKSSNGKKTEEVNLDEILEKIQQQGLDSLSPAEKAYLERYRN
jgi:predicted PurR-regulated permease PerM